MLMTEWNGLRLADAGVGNEGGSLNRVGDPSQTSNDKYGAENSGARQRVRAAMKDLRHFSYEIWLKRPDGILSSVRQFSRAETTHRGFRFVSETGNYKYFAELCRGFLKIR